MRRLRWLVVPAVLVPIGLLLMAGFGRDPRQIASPLIGREAPAWMLATLDGGMLSSSDLAGRPYVVNFWASWCGPCRDEHPVLARAFTEHPDQLGVVGVLYQDGTDAARSWLAEVGDAGYPTIVDESGAVAIDFGVTGPPETYFVDADGIVRARQFGPLTDALLAEHLVAIGIGS
jgi:cytochrome c biogenesis protein CcmG/thiol:disulfide interchange protein DsbE